MEKHLGRKLRTYEEVHHVNENTLDNNIENLEVVTRSQHAKIHQWYKSFPDPTLNRPHQSGSKNPRSKLTEDDVIDIKTKISRGQSLRGIANEYNVHHKTIQDIKNGITWTHITI